MSASERRQAPPAVAVSTVVFALHPPAGAFVGDDTGEFVEDPDGDAVTIWIPLVRRTRPPFEGTWALPGGPIEWNETLIDTALRNLLAAVGQEPGYLEQLYSFGGLERSAEAQRVVTIAYWALYSAHEDAESGAQAGSSDQNVAWFSADSLPRLAFDHADIVDYALQRLRLKTSYSTVAYRFLGEVFTLGQLRQVHEAVLGQRVDPANFRRQVLAQGHLVDTGETQKGTPFRPARLYRFRAGPDHEQRSTP
ncbi:MAG TPA: NUDIX domain-containing protein [Candidatus Agrococcus pullicola]|uniref:NUDIX domain-containing protein n=1 Tax=Candidatus Agrococcus pullicola TaxID=2838429 RepID=A0A9D1YUB1_9MICO|nr:NUDIX domain-containing protein [Candidatus Agrococcus pullicola]